MSYVFSKDIIAIVHFMEPMIDDLGEIYAYVMLPNVTKHNQELIIKYRKTIEQKYKYDNYIKWMTHMNNAKRNKPILYNNVVYDTHTDEEFMEYMKSRMAEYRT